MNAVQPLLQNFSPLRRFLFHPWRHPSSPLFSFSSQVQPSIQASAPLPESHLKFLLFSCSTQGGNLRVASSVHALTIKIPPFLNPHIPTSPSVIYNSLLHVYCKCGLLQDAVKVFDAMPLRDTISWNSLISGFLKLGHFQIGFGYFKLLLRCGRPRLDHASLTSTLSACDGMEWLRIVQMIHALAILNGYERDVPVGNALTTSYFRCQSFESGMLAFNEMSWRNVVTWTAAISGLAQNEFYAESMKLFVKMRQGTVSPNSLTYLSALLACSGLRALKEGLQIHAIVWKLGICFNLCIESALMDMYAKCGCVELAWRIFESAVAFDKVSLTILLVGFAQNGFNHEAVKLFAKIVNAGTNVDPDMISAVLGVSGFEISQNLGLQIHSLIVKKGFTANLYVTNGLINMYSKCGDLDGSIKVFDSMPRRNQVSFNSIIGAFARHGDGLKALQLYEEMQSEGVEPTVITFVSLLQVCSHIGLVHKGFEFLQSMEKHYGLCPRMEHYACMVDVLGRAGLLKEAKDFIEGLPVKPDMYVWQTLLGACSIYADMDIGKYAAEKLVEAAPDSPGPYVVMANIYCTRGRWKERAAMMKKMREEGVSKDTGVSWIEVDKGIHSFVVADEIHPRIEDVWEVLWMLLGHMRDKECVKVDGVLLLRSVRESRLLYEN